MVHTCSYILMYKHVCTLFRPVCTCLYKYIRVSTYIEYRHVHTTYKHVHTCLLPISCLHTCMSKYVQLMFSVQMATYILSNVQTLLNVVCTLMYPLRCSFLICPAGWPVGRVCLLPGVTPIQVQAH